MSHLSTSNSNHNTKRRIIIDILWLVLVLIALETFVRVPPVHDFLALRIDPYENLLYYDNAVPRYINDLKQNPDYTFWLAGSSYMMTGINPEWVQAQAEDTGVSLTVQNFGLTQTTNLAVLATVFEYEFLTVDKPEVLVLYLSEFNLGGQTVAAALDGDYERVLLFPDSLDERIAGFLYKHSDLYRYLVLARNLPVISYEDALRTPRSTGGYTERTNTYNCPQRGSLQRVGDTFESTLQINLTQLQVFIDLADSLDIPLIVLHLPLPNCTLENLYTNYDDYNNRYLQPVRNHVIEQGISFYALDTQFYSVIPLAEQHLYFSDATHPNEQGATLFSQWTAEILVDWLVQYSSQLENE